MLSSRTLHKSPREQGGQQQRIALAQAVEDKYTISSSPRNRLGILRVMNTAHSASV